MPRVASPQSPQHLAGAALRCCVANAVSVGGLMIR